MGLLLSLQGENGTIRNAGSCSTDTIGVSPSGKTLAVMLAITKIIIGTNTRNIDYSLQEK
jgi:hypothetical protein